jgi:hypothetical protein
MRKNAFDPRAVLANGGEEFLERVENAAGIILGVSGNRSWIELFFEGDAMHTRTVGLPAASIYDIYVEEIPHKATVYEHPRTMIFFETACDLEIRRDGDRIFVRAVPAASSAEPGNAV